MKKAEIPCPDVVVLKKHILVMSFIGKDHVPAPKLKEAHLGPDDLARAYLQVLHVSGLTPHPHSSLPLNSLVYSAGCVSPDDAAVVPAV